MDSWYYAKKWFSVFPGVRQARSAPFLVNYYQQRRTERSTPRVAVDALVWLGVQLWAPLRARAVARKFGLDAEWARRTSGIARRRFTDPNDIAVFRIASDAEADRYMRRFEYAEISKRINPAAWARDCVLADKAHFAARCAEHGLPSPPLLARVVGRTVTVLAEPDTDEVAVKPTRGLGGAGFALLAVPEEARGREAFARLLRERFGSGRGDRIVQPRVKGHPLLADIALDALSTARVTTMRNEAGGLEIVTATLRFAGKADAAVDNLAAGGLMAPIDPESGRLGPACYGRKPTDVSVHPLTGAAIEGRMLPLWAEARALVLDAHARGFAEYSMIGWDVGIGADGPVLIEGNGKPGLFAAQRAARSGVGETRFGALIAHHLAVAAERRVRR